MKIISNE